MTFVKGINNTIKITKGTDRNIFTIAAIIELTNLFSHIFPLEVKNSNKPKPIPIISDEDERSTCHIECLNCFFKSFVQVYIWKPTAKHV